MDLLNPAVHDLLSGERRALQSLHGLLGRTHGAEPATLEQLAELIAHLDELFLVVVVGEFNAGKSSVLNALFGQKLMEEGPIPTTAKITILRYGAEPMERQLSESVVERRQPAELLKYLNLVDTPGTNSIVREHQQITEEFIPRADLILFVTSFDRPLSDSERAFLTFIRGSWGKRMVVVLNKVDLARDNEATVRQVIAHIESGCRELMGFDPKIFPVSAELAYAAKASESAAVRDTLWAKSGYGPFEDFITRTLTGPERLSLKLTAPLDSADRLIAALDGRLTDRRDGLAADEANLAGLNGHLTDARAELTEGYGRFLAEVDNLLLEMERRGVRFLEDSIRIAGLPLLRDRDKFKEEFARQVVRDSERQIEDRMTEAVDWLLRHALTLWNRTLNTFAEQVRAGTDGRRISPARSEFVYNREEVFGGIMREAKRKIEGYNVHEEGRRLLENARGAASTFLGVEAVAAAVGVGTLVATLASTAALDVTGGFITAGVLAALGLIFLPQQKRRAIADFRERVETLRVDLRKALTAQLDREIDTTLGKVSSSVAPYVKLVETERADLDRAEVDRSTITADLARIRADVHRTLGAVTLGS